MKFKSSQISARITADDGTKKTDGSPDQNGKAIDSDNIPPCPIRHIIEIKEDK
uniref:Uncharacterized protein n=1 Tax=Cyclobacterium qasimii TaxID=1350429 RepID=A0A512CCG3_9BACT|nr:hypothetical protein CQA01_24010 [Cyclobacterium qasimii]